jgi:hypothetical protein
MATVMARGTCPVCGTQQAVRKDGTMRGHWEAGTSHRCQGSGWGPVAPR